VVATSRQRIEQCQALARAARLRLESVTITGASFAVIDGSEAERSLILSLAPIGNELVIHRHGVPTHLRHLTMTNGQAIDSSAVIAELRRVVAGLGDERAPNLVIYGERGLGRAIEEAAGDELTVALRTTFPGSGRDIADQYAPAAAVAIAAFTAKKPGVDFLHSRLAPAAPQEYAPPPGLGRRDRRTLLVVVVGAWYDLLLRATAA